MKAIAGAIVLAAGSLTVCFASISDAQDRGIGMFAGAAVIIVGLIGYVLALSDRKE